MSILILMVCTVLGYALSRPIMWVVNPMITGGKCADVALIRTHRTAKPVNCTVAKVQRRTNRVHVHV